jgi:hypothetical protein
MFRLPSLLGDGSSGGCSEEGAKGSFFPQKFSRFFGISIDEGKGEVLADSLSLKGRLFEIYFVRLIGTPNQNSKSPFEVPQGTMKGK